MDFSFISTHVFNIVLYLSAPLVLVILATCPFEDAFITSPRVSNLAHFQHVLWTSFQVCSLSEFLTFLKPFEAPFDTIFEKKRLSENRFKKGDPPLEND